MTDNHEIRARFPHKPSRDVSFGALLGLVCAAALIFVVVLIFAA
jgi:hypothetical protein